jgi:hypothetical protein
VSALHLFRQPKTRRAFKKKKMATALARLKELVGSEVTQLEVVRTYIVRRMPPNVRETFYTQYMNWDEENMDDLSIKTNNLFADPAIILSLSPDDALPTEWNIPLLMSKLAKFVRHPNATTLASGEYMPREYSIPSGNVAPLTTPKTSIYFLDNYMKWLLAQGLYSNFRKAHYDARLDEMHRLQSRMKMKEGFPQNISDGHLNAMTRIVAARYEANIPELMKNVRVEFYGLVSAIYPQLGETEPGLKVLVEGTVANLNALHIIPTHVGSAESGHYILLVIDNTVADAKWTIAYFDSSKNPSAEYAKNVTDIIRKPIDTRYIDIIGQDGAECGPLVIGAMATFIEGLIGGTTITESLQKVAGLASAELRTTSLQYVEMIAKIIDHNIAHLTVPSPAEPVGANWTKRLASPTQAASCRWYLRTPPKMSNGDTFAILCAFQRIRPNTKLSPTSSATLWRRKMSPTNWPWRNHISKTRRASKSIFFSCSWSLSHPNSNTSNSLTKTSKTN